MHPFTYWGNRGISKMKGLHTVNGILFLLNALLWALVAKQPAMAIGCLAVAVAEIYVVTKTTLLSN